MEAGSHVSWACEFKIKRGRSSNCATKMRKGISVAAASNRGITWENKSLSTHPNDAYAVRYGNPAGCFLLSPNALI
jgi:hypothetical protein